MPRLVKANPGIFELFREERPALGDGPGQGGWCRVVSALGRLGP